MPWPILHGPCDMDHIIWSLSSLVQVGPSKAIDENTGTPFLFLNSDLTIFMSKIRVFRGFIK